MSTPRALWELLRSLPLIIEILKSIQKAIDEAQLERKVSDDLKVVHNAFSERDASKLNALFRSR